MCPMLLLGLTFLAFGLYAVYTYFRDERKNYTIVPGKIVAFERHTDRKGYKGFTTFFEYFYNGTVYRCSHNITLAKYCKNSKIDETMPRIYYTKNISIVPNTKYKIGDSVEVRVYEDEPENARIHSASSFRMPFIVGTVSALIGIAVLTVYFVFVR